MTGGGIHELSTAWPVRIPVVAEFCSGRLESLQSLSYGHGGTVSFREVNLLEEGLPAARTRVLKTGPHADAGHARRPRNVQDSNRGKRFIISMVTKSSERPWSSCAGRQCRRAGPSQVGPRGNV
jgi:hypothetical protein